MLKKFWRWLQNLFTSLFGSGQKKKVAVENLPPLSDTDYEILFSQLLEGVAQGWLSDRVQIFFEKLGSRGEPEEWVPWLNRFGEKVLANPNPNNELATRMILFGQQAQSLRRINKMGDVAHDLGMQILTRGNPADIWEYAGPDDGATINTIDAATNVTNTDLPDGEVLLENPQPEGQYLTWDELLEKLQTDPNLLASLAQQLGLTTDDPQVIISELVKRLGGQQE
ncbi:MAG: hypothetical protein ACRC2J_10260 [Microcoleaceae cyanobacterium]